MKKYIKYKNKKWYHVLNIVESGFNRKKYWSNIYRKYSIQKKSSTKCMISLVTLLFTIY